MANLTIMDYARQLDESGKASKIVEMMSKVNEIMDDMVVVPSNMTEAHKATLRTGLSAGTWRTINKGVVPSKSSNKQIVFTPGMIEKFGQVDEELANLYSDIGGFRVNENVAHIEGISQQLATAIFYGNQTTDPEQLTGLSYYLNDPTSEAGKANLINGGGAGDDNTSLWLVVWGENTVHGFFPKNTKAGIEHNDLGLQLVEDGITTGAKFRAYVDQFKSKLGLAPKDWRYMVRICNLDVSALATAGDTSDSSANLIKLMVQAANKVPSLRAGKAAWYCNKEVKTALDVKALDKSNLMLTMKDIENGMPVTQFMGIPVRRCDALVNNEAKITGF